MIGRFAGVVLAALALSASAEGTKYATAVRSDKVPVVDG